MWIQGLQPLFCYPYGPLLSLADRVMDKWKWQIGKDIYILYNLTLLYTSPQLSL